VVGEVGIQEELDLVGVPHIGGPADGDKKIDLSPGNYMEHDKDVGAVVVGFDRYFNYYKIQYATLCLRENPGCQYIATNTDAVTHLTDAQEWAGNGSMVRVLSSSSLHVQVDTFSGKVERVSAFPREGSIRTEKSRRATVSFSSPKELGLSAYPLPPPVTSSSHVVPATSLTSLLPRD
jgi:hypothetical protein